MAIRKRGKGQWQVRVRPFPDMTVPTREAAQTVELDLKLRVKLGHLYREKPVSLGRSSTATSHAKLRWAGGEARSDRSRSRSYSSRRGRGNRCERFWSRTSAVRWSRTTSRHEQRSLPSPRRTSSSC